MWESFDYRNWKVLPHIAGRIATEQDVKNGIAVFYIPDGSKALDCLLPTCVIQINEDDYSRKPAVVIQAERAGDQVYLGLRYLDGGNGVCTLDEVEQLDEPNEEFTMQQSD